MKLSKYAKEVGISYRTAWRWFKEGNITGYQSASGTIVVTENTRSKEVTESKVAIYARVSSSENKSNLDTQVSRLKSYCAAKGYKLSKIVKEVGSGINDSRRELLKLLTDPTISLIVVEHKDRLTRLGFNYIESLLSMQGRKIEVINLSNDEKEGLMEDLVAIIYSFCARMYGQRRCKRKTEMIIQELNKEDELS